VDCQRWSSSPAIQGTKVAGFDQLGHHRLHAPAEQGEELIHQPGLGGVARDQRFEDMGVADLARAAQRLLGLQPVNHGLDGGVGGPVLGGEAFLDLADGRRPAVPQDLHDLEFQLA